MQFQNNSLVFWVLEEVKENDFDSVTVICKVGLSIDIFSMSTSILGEASYFIFATKESLFLYICKTWMIFLF